MGFFGLPEEVYTDLVSHYQSGGVSATLLDKNSPETVGGEKAVKISGKNVSLVIPKFARGTVGSGKGFEVGPSISKKKSVTHPVINFHHIVKGKTPTDEKEASATLVAKKKGLLSKQVVGIDWEGGRVAAMLNGDPELNKTLLDNNVGSLKVEWDAKNGCYRIVLQHKIDMVTEASGFVVKKTTNRAEKLPSLQVFEAIDRIAGRIKT